MDRKEWETDGFGVQAAVEGYIGMQSEAGALMICGVPG